MKNKTVSAYAAFSISKRNGNSTLPVRTRIADMVMSFCKTLTILLLLFNLQSATGQSRHTHKTSDSNNPSDFVRIDGSTNINQFSFVQNLNENGNKPIMIDEQGRIILEIPAIEFKASNPLMYNDFIDLIKAKKHPVITITIHHHALEFTQFSSGHFSTKIDIKLAGKEKRYVLPGTLIIVEEHSIRILGELELNLNDFQLDPPTKFLGMVRVNNAVFVNFDFTMENQLISKNL